MPIVFPHRIFGYPHLNSRIYSQHFGVELLPENVIPCIGMRCPAGYLRGWQSSHGQDDTGSNLIEGVNSLKVELDVQQFQPEEIQVNLKDGSIVIEGHHTDKEDGQGFVARHFVRKYDIPENSDISGIESTLSTDGILSIIIPKRLEFNRIIPIQFSIPHADAA